MEKFYVVHTWNGEGYSESDLLFTSEVLKDATSYAFNKAIEMYIANADVGESLEIENNLSSQQSDQRYISVTEKTTNREDSGCFHVLTGDTNTKGILIRSDYNDATLLTWEGVVQWTKVIIDEAQDDEAKEEFVYNMMHGVKGSCHTDSDGFCKIVKIP